MNLNGVEYYYIRNLQGDIIGLFDKNGTQVVSYTYDTWGKHDGKAELKDENGNVIQQGDIKGTLASTVGMKNPYRYRAYRFDTETGLYYLNSRYYNPEWSRLINADSLGGKVGDLLSHNAFIYCQNNPVMNSDTSGQWFETFLDVVSVVSSLVSFIKSPSWKAATVLAYDCAAAVAPVVPASGTLKAAAKAADALKISKKGSVAKSVASKGVSTAKSIPARGYHKEVYANKPVKVKDAVDKWNEFLGPGKYTNIHPRTGLQDPDRIFSADGVRSIRFGSHEMNSSPSKFHYHEEIWTLDPIRNIMNVDNTVVRVPYK